ncbi:tyrosine-type recombinase/integrase [Novosphingobium bradum]|uniref:Tyrosine-type recombinase/integrase n=1 Tax=Novosphingobium bradum TaxID=1737444 RepID=A0ABV7IQU5_9SPHN
MARKFTRLTRPALRILKPGQSVTEHGIVVQRLASGDLRYSINVMVDGQRIHRIVGRESEGVTREQAERAIESLRTKALEGRLDLPTGRKVQRSIAAAAEEYLTQIEHHPKFGRNIGPKRRHLRQRLVPFFGACRIDKLTDFNLAEYVKHRRGEGAAMATVNRELSTLNHFLNRAVDWKWMRADNKPRVVKGEEPQKQIIVLTDAEKRALMQAAIADQDPLTWLFTAIAMGTGMRHGEILRIKWEDIDIGNRRIFIGKAKGGRREQPIPPSLAAILEHEHKQISSSDIWLFPTTRKNAKHANRQQMSEQFRRAVNQAKLDPARVTPHVMRHTAITALIKERVDIPTVQRISGHKTIAMALRYTHLTDDHIDQSVAKLDAGLPFAITPKLHTAPNQGGGETV